jgi:hypothetical protein
MFATTPPVFMTTRVTPEQRDQIGPLGEEVQHAILQLEPYDIITDGGWEYTGTGIHAPFYHPTSSPAHAGGASIIFLSHNWQQQGYVAVQITQGEQVGQGPDQMEPIALLEAMAVRHQFGIKDNHAGTIYSDCESFVDYLNNGVYTRIKNSPGKLPFLMAAQWYLQRENDPLVKWVESHPERREGHSPQHYSYQDWGIFIADCYASAKTPLQDIPCSTYDIPAATLIRNSIPSECWYLSTPDGTPTMTNPIKRMQDHQLHRY